MPVLSFRTKLVLAMMLLVGAVSVTTLVITQQRVQANHETNLRKQFQQQIGYFAALQKTRLGNVQAESLNLSQLVRLIAYLKESEVDTDALYQTAYDDLKRLAASMYAEARLAGVRGSRPTPLVFLCFLDAKGRPLHPSEDVRKQLPLWIPGKRLGMKLTRFRKALDAAERQQVGYLSLEPEPGDPAEWVGNLTRLNPMQFLDQTNASGLEEVMLTKIVDDQEGGAVAGAMMVGFPLADLIPKPVGPNKDAIHPIRTGILLEGKLYANPTIIPGPEAARIAELVSDKIRARADESSEFDSEIQGTAYRVFYQILNPDSAFAPAYQVCLFSLEEARQELRALRWKILGASAVALVCALLLSLLLAHGLAVPIRELVSGTGEVQRGNFEVKVPVRSRDELGQLAQSFNDMAQGLAQKEKYRTVLNLVADEKIAQQLMSGRIKLGGEVRDVSVVFCDIRGFTAMTENMPPADVIEMLNEHMTALTQVVKAHNGVLDKFVGDLLMAVFGAPFSHGNETLNAARCALELIETREKLNRTSRHSLQVGIGVSSGEVVAGCMGSVDRMNYTVVGQRVNLASRLCSHAAGGEILIDQTSMERLGSSVVTAPAALLQLKGFCDPVQAHKLLSFSSASPDRTHTVSSATQGAE